MPWSLTSWSSSPLLIVTVPSFRSLRGQWESGTGDNLLPCPLGCELQLQMMGPGVSLGLVVTGAGAGARQLPWGNLTEEAALLLRSLAWGALGGKGPEGNSQQGQNWTNGLCRGRGGRTW